MSIVCPALDSGGVFFYACRAKYNMIESAETDKQTYTKVTNLEYASLFHMKEENKRKY